MCVRLIDSGQPVEVRVLAIILSDSVDFTLRGNERHALADLRLNAGSALLIDGYGQVCGRRRCWVNESSTHGRREQKKIEHYSCPWFRRSLGSRSYGSSRPA